MRVCVCLRECASTHVCAHAYMPLSVGAHAMVHEWKPEDVLWELALTFYLVEPRYGTQVVGLSSRHLRLLSRLTGPLLEKNNMVCPTYFGVWLI